MGLAKILFGFDKTDLQNLQQKLNILEAENNQLKTKLQQIQEEQETIRKEYKKLIQELAQHTNQLEQLQEWKTTITQKLELLEQWQLELIEEIRQLYTTSNTQEENTPEKTQEYTNDEKTIIIEKIMEGYTSPTELVKTTGLSRTKIYTILKTLVEEGILEKHRDGRKVKYTIRNDTTKNQITLVKNLASANT